MWTEWDLGRMKRKVRVGDRWDNRWATGGQGDEGGAEERNGSQGLGADKWHQLSTSVPTPELLPLYGSYLLCYQLPTLLYFLSPSVRPCGWLLPSISFHNFPKLHQYLLENWTLLFHPLSLMRIQKPKDFCIQREDAITTFFSSALAMSASEHTCAFFGLRVTYDYWRDYDFLSQAFIISLTFNFLSH